jgi:hypothetical protein
VSFVINFITLDISRSKSNLLAAVQLLIGKKTNFDIEQHSLTCLLKIKTFESSKIVVGSGMAFAVGRSFIDTIKSNDPRIDSWGPSFPF